jgi:hypothetical protein
MFNFDRRRPRTPDELADQIFAINRAYGGKFIDKRKETG